jgi:hypothetical protein
MISRIKSSCTIILGKDVPDIISGSTSTWKMMGIFTKLYVSIMLERWPIQQLSPM